MLQELLTYDNERLVIDSGKTNPTFISDPFGPESRRPMAKVTNTSAVHVEGPEVQTADKKPSENNIRNAPPEILTDPDLESFPSEDPGDMGEPSKSKEKIVEKEKKVKEKSHRC